MTLDVSIIIPVYNGEAFLKECLESVLNQTGCELEFLCVNDASTDQSAKLLTDFAAQDTRIRILTQDVNHGVSAARNRALHEASGKYALFLDCDDFYPDTGCVSALFHTAESNDALVCGGSFAELEPSGRIRTTFTGKKSGYTFPRAERIFFRDFLFEYGFQRFLFRLDFLQKNHIDFPPCTVFEDPVFLVNALLKANSFFAIPKVVYIHRMRSCGPVFTSRKVREMAKAGIDILRLTAGRPDCVALHEKYLRDFFGDFSEGEKNAAGNLFLNLLLSGDSGFAKTLFRATDAAGGKVLPPLARILDSAGLQIPAEETFFESDAWEHMLRRFIRKQNRENFRRCLKENGWRYTLKLIFTRLSGRAG